MYEPKEEKTFIMDDEEFAEFISTAESPKTVLAREHIKLKLLNSDYTFSPKRGRSKIWDAFGRVCDENDMEIPETVACKSCFNIYKFTGSTSNLVKHKCYIIAGQSEKEGQQVNVNAETKQTALELITSWAIESCSPLQMIENTEFKKLAKFLIKAGSTYGANINVDDLFPKPKAISKNINKLYEDRFTQIKEEFLKCKCFGFSLTSDIWTDSYQGTSYLSCNAHYVKDNVIVNRFLALRCLEEESSPGFNVMEQLEQVLKEFGSDIEADQPIIVINRKSPIISVFQEGQIIFCANHLLNEIVEEAIEGTPEMNELVNKCRELVKFCLNFDKVSRVIDSFNVLRPTQSMRVYDLLKSVQQNWYDINTFFSKGQQKAFLNEINLSLLNSVVPFLESFKDTSNKLEDDKLPTIHLTIPYIENLKKKCLANANDNMVLLQFKGLLEQLLTSTVLKNMTKYHRIALFLFPPTNKLVSFSQHDRQTIMMDCKELMKLHVKKDDIDESNENPIKTEIPANDNPFMDFIELPIQTNDNSDKIVSEIHSYCNINVRFSKDFDCFQWWAFHKNIFPLLYQTSCKIFSIPATCIASDRVFSKARNLITQNCSVTNSTNINKTMFLQLNEELNVTET